MSIQVRTLRRQHYPMTCICIYHDLTLCAWVPDAFTNEVTHVCMDCWCNVCSVAWCCEPLSDIYNASLHVEHTCVVMGDYVTTNQSNDVWDFCVIKWKFDMKQFQTPCKQDSPWWKFWSETVEGHSFRCKLLHRARMGFCGPGHMCVYTQYS